MAKRGPKFKIGPAEEKQIFAILSVGGSLADAADCLGIHRETLINQGKRDPKFSKGMMKAAAKGKISLIRRVGKAPQWQAAAWMLERKWGEEFGKKDKLEHTGKDGGAIEVKEQFDHDRFAELYRLRTGRNQPGDGAPSPNGN